MNLELTREEAGIVRAALQLAQNEWHRVEFAFELGVERVEADIKVCRKVAQQISEELK